MTTTTADAVDALPFAISANDKQLTPLPATASVLELIDNDFRVFYNFFSKLTIIFFLLWSIR
jgi:hypothetical protein